MVGIWIFVTRFRVVPQPAAIDKLVTYLFLYLPTDLRPFNGQMLGINEHTNKYIRPSIQGKLLRYG